MHKLKKAPFSGRQTRHFNFTVRSVNTAQNILPTDIFEHVSFSNHDDLPRQHMDAVVCPTFFSGLISMFTFGILQIPSMCIQNCGWCIAPTCTTGLGAAIHTCFRR